MKYLAQSLALPNKNDSVPSKFQSLFELPLVIIVGLTGVGKSTLVSRLADRLDFQLLPNRRSITDEVIISSLQIAAGRPVGPVKDRLARFEYTARYRQQQPGGMAHALGRLVIDRTQISAETLLVFDGLRGLDEVRYAGHHFPRARFVVLDAPDTVRLARLLDRSDTFDTITGQLPLARLSLLEALQNIEHVDTVFSRSELEVLATTAHQSGWAADEVTKKATIIVQERRNYDPVATRDYLQRSIPTGRLCLVDTSHHAPDTATARVVAWLTNNA
jgi:hypothetical protein